MDNFRIHQMLRIVSGINVDLFSPLLHFVVAYNETDPEVPQGDEKTSIEDHGIA